MKFYSKKVMNVIFEIFMELLLTITSFGGLLMSSLFIEGKFILQIFINNEFVDSVSGKKFQTINPTKETVIAEISEGDKVRYHFQSCFTAFYRIAPMHLIIFSFFSIIFFYFCFNSRKKFVQFLRS